MSRAKEFDEIDVLEKAVEVFWCKGYNGTSAQDLVDRLGISRSSLYDTFGDKRSLFKKALEHYRQTAANALIEMIESSNEIEKTIENIFRVTVTEALEDKLSKGCFVVNSTVELASHDEEIRNIIIKNMDDIQNALNDAIKKGQDQGVFSKRHSSLSLSRFAFNSLSGLRVASKASVQKDAFDDIVRISLSVFKL